uniref:Uncharacterized protein n=1 Tax=Anguilla anguilla TaxID=7936 RepID=A0A0E9TA96_ANGAN
MACTWHSEVRIPRATPKHKDSATLEGSFRTRVGAVQRAHSCALAANGFPSAKQRKRYPFV